MEERCGDGGVWLLVPWCLGGSLIGGLDGWLVCWARDESLTFPGSQFVRTPCPRARARTRRCEPRSSGGIAGEVVVVGGSIFETNHYDYHPPAGLSPVVAGSSHGWLRSSRCVRVLDKTPSAPVRGIRESAVRENPSIFPVFGGQRGLRCGWVDPVTGGDRASVVLRLAHAGGLCSARPARLGWRR